MELQYREGREGRVRKLFGTVVLCRKPGKERGRYERQ
jgi:hypothetical protein